MPRRAIVSVVAIVGACLATIALSCDGSRCERQAAGLSGAAGAGDPYYPGTATAAMTSQYDLHIAYNPLNDDSGAGRSQGESQRELVQRQSRPSRIRDKANQGTWPCGRVETRRPRTHGYPKGSPEEGLSVFSDPALQRGSGRSQRSHLRPADSIHSNQRRRSRRWTTGVRRDLVPRQ